MRGRIHLSRAVAIQNLVLRLLKNAEWVDGWVSGSCHGLCCSSSVKSLNNFTEYVHVWVCGYVVVDQLIH